MPKLPCAQLRLCFILRSPCPKSPCPKSPCPKVSAHVLYSRSIVKSRFWGPSEAEGSQHTVTCININPNSCDCILYRNRANSWRSQLSLTYVQCATSSLFSFWASMGVKKWLLKFWPFSEALIFHRCCGAPLLCNLDSKAGADPDKKN
jgi:hypothetical protein